MKRYQKLIVTGLFVLAVAIVSVAAFGAEPTVADVTYLYGEDRQSVSATVNWAPWFKSEPKWARIVRPAFGFVDGSFDGRTVTGLPTTITPWPHQPGAVTIQVPGGGGWEPSIGFTVGIPRKAASMPVVATPADDWFNTPGHGAKPATDCAARTPAGGQSCCTDREILASGVQAAYEALQENDIAAALGILEKSAEYAGVDLED